MIGRKRQKNQPVAQAGMLWGGILVRRWLGLKSGLAVGFWLIAAFAPAVVLNGAEGFGDEGLAPAEGEMVVEELIEDPIFLRTAEEAVVYTGPDFRRRAGVMRGQTRVRVASIKGDKVRVRGRAVHAEVAGWLRMDQLESPDPDFFANLKAMYERHLLVSDLIEKNQVALGMTIDEVRASLGKPTRKSSELTAEGRVDTLEYAIFERVPQLQTVRGNDGRLYRSTIYVEVETGNLKVSFKDNQVVSIAEEEGLPVPGGDVKIVPSPIILF